jgi:6-phosphogluconolactonase
MIVYTGSYTLRLPGNQGGHGEGIYCLDFDPTTGKLKHLNTTPAVNPTYLSIPVPGFLYTHTELVEAEHPHMQTYRIDPGDHSLHLMGEVPVPGGYPCHVSYSEKYHAVIDACYQTGSVVIYPVGASGELLPAARVLQHHGTGPNAARQERAHTHCVVVNDTLDRLLVTDLGIDRIMIYKNAGSAGVEGFALSGEVVFPGGSGPRHIATHPSGRYHFVVSEMTSTVGVLRDEAGAVELLGVYESLPEALLGEGAAAAIRVSPDGRHVYVSDRADGHIAVFRFDQAKEGLELLTRVDTGGRTPRDIIFDPTGGWMLAAVQDIDAVRVFRVDAATGGLEFTHELTGIRSPACFTWWPEGAKG